MNKKYKLDLVLSGLSIVDPKLLLAIMVVLFCHGSLSLSTMVGTPKQCNLHLWCSGHSTWR